MTHSLPPFCRPAHLLLLETVVSMFLVVSVSWLCIARSHAEKWKASLLFDASGYYRLLTDKQGNDNVKSGESA